MVMLCAPITNTFKAEVSRIIDGDTFEVRIDGQVEKIRIIGLDTPELHHPQKPVQYFAKKAKQHAKELLQSKTVELHFDDANKAKKNRGYFGRLLCHVFLQDGQNFALKMIRDGYGHALTRYPFEPDMMEAYRIAEREAKEQKRGFWASDGTSSTGEKPAVETETGGPPGGCRIKGNINSRGERIYHLPGMRFYEATKIDESKGERWLCTEEEALNAGWRKSNR